MRTLHIMQSYIPIWLVVLTILQHMSSSMGRMTSHIWNGQSHVWNHQPVYIIPTHLQSYYIYYIIVLWLYIYI
jgi:hypothetical protein